MKKDCNYLRIMVRFICDIIKRISCCSANIIEVWLTFGKNVDFTNVLLFVELF